MSYHLGVDLGTTYTAAAVARDGRAEAVTLGTRSLSVPSVVHLAGDQIVVGEPAARRATTDPSGVVREFKRRVGDPTPILVGGAPVAAELLMARTLAWVVDHVSTTEGERPESLAVSHPANWGRYKLDLLAQAVRHVGLTVDRFVPEPVAAATTYAVQRPLAPGSAVAVYDLGGGTFDAAVVRVGDDGFHIAGRPDGIERLGGIDFDHAVFRHVLDVLGLDADDLDPGDDAMAAGLAQLRHECVEAKEALSSETDVSIPVMLPSRHTAVRLTRAEFEAMIRPALAETVVALRRAIESADLEVTDVSAVLLVGGSSRIPLVGQMVGADLGLPIAVDARPKEAIPVGAALAVLQAEASRPEPEPPVAVAAAPGALVAPAPGSAAVAPGSAPVAPGSDPASTASPVAPGPPPAPVEPAPEPAAGPLPPPGVGDAPAPAGGPGLAGDRRPLLVGAVALVAVAAVVVAVLATRGGGQGGDDPPDNTTGDATTVGSDTTTPGSIPTTAGSNTTTGSAGGSLGSASNTGSRLPGDDWNPEARGAFVDQCVASQIAGSMELAGADPGTGCACIYDTVSQDMDFATFNEVWTDDDVDTSDPDVQALANATTSCTLGG